MTGAAVCIETHHSKETLLEAVRDAIERGVQFAVCPEPITLTKPVNGSRLGAGKGWQLSIMEPFR
jgi:predicted peroxiredoxin